MDAILSTQLSPADEANVATLASELSKHDTADVHVPIDGADAADAADVPALVVINSDDVPAPAPIDVVDEADVHQSILAAPSTNAVLVYDPRTDPSKCTVERASMLLGRAHRKRRADDELEELEGYQTSMQERLGDTEPTGIAKKRCKDIDRLKIVLMKRANHLLEKPDPIEVVKRIVEGEQVGPFEIYAAFEKNARTNFYDGAPFRIVRQEIKQNLEKRSFSAEFGRYFIKISPLMHADGLGADDAKFQLTVKAHIRCSTVDASIPETTIYGKTALKTVDALLEMIRKAMEGVCLDPTTTPMEVDVKAIRILYSDLVETLASNSVTAVISMANAIAAASFHHMQTLREYRKAVDLSLIHI